MLQRLAHELAAAFTAPAHGENAVKAPQPVSVPHKIATSVSEMTSAADDYAPESDDVPTDEGVVTYAQHHTVQDDDDGRDWVAEAQQSWPLIRKLCRQKPPMGAVVGGLLSAVDPIRCEQGQPLTLVLRAKFDVHVTKLRDQGMRQVVEWALEQALGQQFRVHVVASLRA